MTVPWFERVGITLSVTGDVCITTSTPTGEDIIQNVHAIFSVLLVYWLHDNESVGESMAE